MKLRDNQALRDAVIDVCLDVQQRRVEVYTATDRILDAVNRHQQAALPAVGGATNPFDMPQRTVTELQAKVEAVCAAAIKAVADPPSPPPPVSGSPQAGEGETCGRCGSDGKRIKETANVILQSSDFIACDLGTGRTPSSPRVAATSISETTGASSPPVDQEKS